MHHFIAAGVCAASTAASALAAILASRKCSDSDTLAGQVVVSFVACAVFGVAVGSAAYLFGAN